MTLAGGCWKQVVTKREVTIKKWGLIPISRQPGATTPTLSGFSKDHITGRRHRQMKSTSASICLLVALPMEARKATISSQGNSCSNWHEWRLAKQVSRQNVTRQDNITSYRPTVFRWEGHGLYPHQILPPVSRLVPCYTIKRLSFS